MIALRARLPAIAIVAAMLVTGTTPLANELPHRVCLVHHHDCGKTARLVGRCCLVLGDRSDEATPPAGKNANRPARLRRRDHRDQRAVRGDWLIPACARIEHRLAVVPS